jgi:hypothetical protein
MDDVEAVELSGPEPQWWKWCCLNGWFLVCCHWTIARENHTQRAIHPATAATYINQHTTMKIRQNMTNKVGFHADLKKID